MEDITRLFDDFAEAYRRSLYAIEREQQLVAKARAEFREQVKKRFDRNRSLAAKAASDSLMSNMHRLNDAFHDLTRQEDSVLRAAEYLAFGNAVPQNIDRLSFSDSTLPWVMPFLGHRNVYIESNGDDCQTLGLQFAIHALSQTAPGQLHVSVVNPELRPEFSPCSRLPEFKMLTSDDEIKELLSSLTAEIIQTDTLLQGKYPSLLALRRAAQQPVGQLQLLIFQDLPKEWNKDQMDALTRLARGAPRAGILVLFLNSKTSGGAGGTAGLKQSQNFFVLSQSGNRWRSTEPYFEKLIFSFPILGSNALAHRISDILETSKSVSAITIPFGQIEETNRLWEESSAASLTFHLGKAGLDTVSVCLGDSVSQQHNILISGAAGKGKSNLLEVMIHSLCTCYSPQELEMYLLDFKDGLTFKPYAAFADGTWLPHARMLGLESNRDVGLAVLKDLETERRNRAILFGDSAEGVHDFESYRKHNPDKHLPRIVLIIDEYQKLFDIADDISEEAASLLENLVRQGRACAIHIILASQSITGAAGLLGKEDRIYPQFPVRIALQNTVSESFSIFGVGNDAASRLRVRGEAIINVNYGAVDSNRKFTVAFADPAEMRALRQTYCKAWPQGEHPIIFAKKDTVDYSMLIPSVRKWRTAAADGSAIRIPCGVMLSISKEVLSVTLANDTGRNVAILGAAEDLQAGGDLPGRRNMAVGMLEGFGLSLALQHPGGNARFVLIDGLAADIRKNCNLQRWLRLMERFGFPVEVVGAADAATWLMGFHQEVQSGCDEEDTYILGFGMDRCSDFTQCSLSGESGASAFQELLQLGVKGIHFLCWWSSVSMYKNHIGFSGDGYIGTKVLLRMDTDTARDVLGAFVNWGIRDNRACIHDAADLAADCTVMPLLPLTDRVSGLIEAEAW